MQNPDVTVEIASDVVDILIQLPSVPLSSINAIVCSHRHVLHTGDPSLIPSNPKTHPGYPKNPDTLTIQGAFEGRRLIELDFNESQFNVCGSRAIDWFKGGVFYIEAPGHSPWRVLLKNSFCSSETSLIIAANTVLTHFFSPSLNRSLPSPFEPPKSLSPCPGSVFQSIHPSADNNPFRSTPFYEAAPKDANGHRSFSCHA